MRERRAGARVGGRRAPNDQDAGSGVRRMGPPREARQIRLSMKVWDAPVRLFHWAVVILVITSYVSVHSGRMQLHLLSGYAMLALLLFRLAWGFVGSETARFASFLTRPVRAFIHLSRFPRREADDEIGHNAAGGWMVLVMLLLLAVQVGTGLFSNDNNDPFTVYGPLAKYVGDDASNRITRIHIFNFNLILAAIGLHILAILAYWAVKRQNLLKPMITGRKRLPGTARQPRMASPVLALALLVLTALIVWTLVRFA